MKIGDLKKRIQFSYQAVPLILLALGLLSYGPLSVVLGTHWDDWPSLWFLNNWGPTIFPQVFAADRPVQGWLFILTTSLFGDSMFAWQIFGILARCLGGLALWWTLRLLWPHRPQQALWVALLFTVYPGFTHQYISITYSHILLYLALFLLSITTMLLAQRNPQRFWPLTLVSLALQTVSMLLTEYYIGLELLRPILIWLSQPEQEKTSLRKRWLYLLRSWLPYTVPVLLFVAWRVTNPTPRAEILIVDELLRHPSAALLGLVRTALQDMYEASLGAWGSAFDLSGLRRLSPANLTTFIVIATGAGALVYSFLSKISAQGTPDGQQRLQPPDSEEEPPGARRRWAGQTLLVGLYALAVSGLPIWGTDLHMELAFPWDRFTLPMMLGVSVALVGLLELLSRKHTHSLLIVSLAVGLAAGMHYRIALQYRQDWLMQRDFFWQLAWRAPGIQPGTALLTSKLPFNYSTDNSLTAPLNSIYAPKEPQLEPPALRLSYLLYDIESRLGGGLPSLEAGQPIDEPYRIAPFHGNTSQVMLVIYRPPDCLRIIDPLVDRHSPNKPPYIRQALWLSRPELISDSGNPEVWVERLYGAEPKQDWCYYYEKADLARQAGDWQRVAELASQAVNPNQPFAWRNAAELALFIEGLARTGRWSKAAALTLHSYEASESNLPVLCDLWGRLYEAANLDQQGQNALAEVSATLQCPGP